LRGSSERVLAQLGHSTSLMPLSRKRFGSISTTPGKVHLSVFAVFDEIAGCSTLNPCFAACALCRIRECTQVRGTIRRMIGGCGAGKSDRISKQSLEFLLALGFCQLHFAFPCASLHFHTDPLVRLQSMSFERLDG